MEVDAAQVDAEAKSIAVVVDVVLMEPPARTRRDLKIAPREPTRDAALLDGSFFFELHFHHDFCYTVSLKESNTINFDVVDVASSPKADAAPTASEMSTRRPSRPRKTLPVQHPPPRREQRRRHLPSL